jgi:hypothetical protein
MRPCDSGAALLITGVSRAMGFSMYVISPRVQAHPDSQTDPDSSHSSLGRYRGTLQRIMIGNGSLVVLNSMLAGFTLMFSLLENKKCSELNSKN